jgi:hypothetical protein
MDSKNMESLGSDNNGIEEYSFRLGERARHAREGSRGHQIFIYGVQ